MPGTDVHLILGEKWHLARDLRKGQRSSPGGTTGVPTCGLWASAGERGWSKGARQRRQRGGWEPAHQGVGRTVNEW